MTRATVDYPKIVFVRRTNYHFPEIEMAEKRVLLARTNLALAKNDFLPPDGLFHLRNDQAWIFFCYRALALLNYCPKDFPLGNWRRHFLGKSSKIDTARSETRPETGGRGVGRIIEK